MDQTTTNAPAVTVSEQVHTRQPNEQSRLNSDEFLRITDPETKQVFVEQRA